MPREKHAMYIFTDACRTNIRVSKPNTLLLRNGTALQHCVAQDHIIILKKRKKKERESRKKGGLLHRRLDFGGGECAREEGPDKES